MPHMPAPLLDHLYRLVAGSDEQFLPDTCSHCRDLYAALTTAATALPLNLAGAQRPPIVEVAAVDVALDGDDDPVGYAHTLDFTHSGPTLVIGDALLTAICTRAAAAGKLPRQSGTMTVSTVGLTLHAGHRLIGRRTLSLAGALTYNDDSSGDRDYGLHLTDEEVSNARLANDQAKTVVTLPAHVLLRARGQIIREAAVVYLEESTAEVHLVEDDVHEAIDAFGANALRMAPVTIKLAISDAPDAIARTWSDMPRGTIDDPKAPVEVSMDRRELGKLATDAGAKIDVELGCRIGKHRGPFAPPNPPSGGPVQDRGTVRCGHCGATGSRGDAALWG